jgi:intracellular septation protein
MSHTSHSPKGPAPPKWLMPLTDYGPLIAFFVAYWFYDLMTATAVVIGATVLAVAVSLVVTRKVPWMPLITAALVGVFGGLTLYLADETFIKIKPTIVQVLFATLLLGALALGKMPLKLVMGRSFHMPDPAWRTLTIRFALFFLAMAALNEVIWRTQSTDLWVSFDTFGQLILTFLFIGAQIPFMMRHGEDPDEVAAEKPADGD